MYCNLNIHSTTNMSADQIVLPYACVWDIFCGIKYEITNMIFKEQRNILKAMILSSTQNITACCSDVNHPCTHFASNPTLQERWDKSNAGSLLRIVSTVKLAFSYSFPYDMFWELLGKARFKFLNLYFCFVIQNKLTYFIEQFCIWANISVHVFWI